MELKVGVKILLKNKEDRYLVLRRSTLKYPEIGGSWDIAGGRITVGETLLENLKREVIEETGLLMIKEPELIFAQDIIRSDDKHTVRLTYTGYTDGEVILSDEHDEYRWLTFEELKDIEPMNYYIKEIINKKLI